eukprot:g7973.t1
MSDGAKPLVSQQADDEQVRATINMKLEETGMKEALKEEMRQKLIEAGWRDKLKERCKEIIRRKGLEKVSVDELVKEITPFGRESVPDEVKAEMLQKLRHFLETTPTQ